MKSSHHKSNLDSSSVARPVQDNKNEEDVMGDLPSEEMLLQAACQKLGGGLAGDTFLIRNSLHVSRADRQSKRGGKRPTTDCQR